MNTSFVKSIYSFSYSSKGVFIIDNNSLKKTKISVSRFNKVTTIKGKILGTSFVVKSGVEKHFVLKDIPHVRKYETSDRTIYLNNKKIGVLKRDFEVIQDINAIGGIPTILRMDDYKVIYFHPYVRKIDLFCKAELIGYTKKNKDKYDLYTKSEETLPLLLAICLASFNSSII